MVASNPPCTYLGATKSGVIPKSTTLFQASKSMYFKSFSGINIFLGKCLLFLGATISSIQPFLFKNIFAFVNFLIPHIV